MADKEKIGRNFSLHFFRIDSNQTVYMRKRYKIHHYAVFKDEHTPKLNEQKCYNEMRFLLIAKVENYIYFRFYKASELVYPRGSVCVQQEVSELSRRLSTKHAIM